MNLKLISLTLIIIIVNTSCKTADQRRAAAIEKYGYIDDVESTKENIKYYANKWGIEPQDLYYMDQEGYNKTIWSFNDENKRLTHDLYQWHQLFVFDNLENLLSYQLNCRTKRDDHEWNYNSLGTFNSYPPTDNSLKKFNKDLQLSQISAHFIGENGISLKEEGIADSEIVIVTYWSIYHGRQSENMIELVRDYKEKQADKNIKLVFVNHY